MSEMAEEWIIRVQGKEYGPADINTLREWTTEGRVLPQNEARRVQENLWTTAAGIPGLFDANTVVPDVGRSAQQPPLPARSFVQILAQTFRIYWTGFLQFLSLTLLAVLPSVCGQLATAQIQAAPNMNVDFRTATAGAFDFCMMVLTLLLWPIYIAGIQILTADFSAGIRLRFVAALHEAVKCWPRVAALCLLVYGGFFLLIVFAFGIATMVIVGASSLVVILLAVALLTLQVWMFGRFFINVLFWQQFAVLENAGIIDSLRKSRNLARSGRDLAWFQRPLWRGVFIASIWFALVLAITLGPQWAALQNYFHAVTVTQDPQVLLEKLTATQEAHGFDILSFALNLLQRILQPLLGISFVLLYLDTKAGNHPS